MSDAGRIVLVAGRPRYASFGPMTADLAQALEDMGFSTSIVWLDPATFDGDAFLARLATWRDQRPRAVLCWNAKLDLRPGGVSIHDALDIPLLNLLVDQPAVHAERLRALPRNHLTTYMDRRHAAYLEEALPGARLAFLPHGGPPPRPDAPSMDERDIPVLMVGNLHAPMDLAGALAQTLERPRDGSLEQTAERMVARCVESLEDPFAAAMAELAAMATPPDPRQLRMAAERLTPGLVGHASNEHRLRLLAALGETPVMVVGRAEAGVSLPRAGASVRFTGPLSFSEVLELMRRARIVINVTPTLSHGAHERVFYGLAAGAAVLTLRSAFLEETFHDGRDILFHDAGGAGLTARLGTVLSDTEALSALVAAGREVLTAHHTWSSRARVLKEFLAGPA